MKSILITAILLSASLGLANTNTKTITCEFTEPFFALTFDLEKKVLLWRGPNKYGDTSEKLMGTELELKEASQDPLITVYELNVPLANRLLTLTYDFNGSDGMSNVLYPISAQWGAPGDEMKLHGGCYTDQVPPVDFEEDPNMGEIEEY